MAHEKEILRSAFEAGVKYHAGRDLPYHGYRGKLPPNFEEWYNSFLSTLPEEKEETHCKLKQEIHTCKIWQDRKGGCWGCVNYIEFNPSK